MLRRQFFHSAVTFTCCWLLGVLCAFASEPSDPWDGAAFSGDPAAVLRSAAAIPVAADIDAVVLLDEEEYEFDPEGRLLHRRHNLYRILDQGAVESWDSVGGYYEPWHQERPVIRARVISGDGAVHWMDPQTLDDAPVKGDSPQVYDDRRILRGPLPAVAAGSVVEIEAVTRETVPFFAPGTVYNVYLGWRVPVRKSRLIIDAPVSLPLRYRVQAAPQLVTSKSESGGRVRYVFEEGIREPSSESERNLPGDVAEDPRVAFSTGPSWQEIAAAYDRIVNRQVQGAALHSAVEAATRGRATREERAAALLAYLHREIRYTGVEFGEAALVPRTPAETLQRKYGDCKDKAAFFVALLREAHIPAYVALLNSGFGQDTDPELPGMNFNHAIVYLPGPTDYWVEVTDEFSRLTDIPSGNQGRSALVAGVETTGLVRVPELPSSANQVVETREFHLAEYGSARVTETTEVNGSAERSYRSYYGSTAEKDIRENLQEYAKSAYLSERVAHYEASPARDLSVPFRLKLELEQAKRGSTDFSIAVVAIRLEGLLNRLPDFFFEEPENEKPTESEGQPAIAPQKKHRQHDFLLPEAFANEWHYRVIPPPGFRVRSLPKNGTQQLGPAKLTREFLAGPDEVVTARLRFDTVKRRYTPQEAEALRAAIKELNKAQVPSVLYEQIGWTHLEAGRVREALEEFRTLMALHPKEALHHMQQARALLVAGLGDGAREEARRAISIEPKSARAQETLAWILLHDLVGRRFRKGFDFEGSLAAYRKARELDPSVTSFTADLAILLEHGASGERYADKAKVQEAIREYLSLGDKLEESGMTDNLLVALLWAERFHQLEVRAAALPATANRQGLQIVAAAAQRGAAAALTESARIVPEEAARRQVQLAAGETLLRLRLYEAAAEILAAGARGNPNAAQLLARAEFLRKIRRADDISLTSDTLEGFVKQVFAFLLLGTPKYEDSLRFESRLALGKRRVEEGRKKFDDSLRSLRVMTRRQDMPSFLIADVTLSVVQVTATGDDATGYRVQLLLPGQPSRVIFVVKEDGQYKALADGEDPDEIGLEVLARLKSGDEAGARTWLDWAREEQPLKGGDDALSGPVFPRFWTRSQQAGVETMRYAAAALLASGWDADLAIPIIVEGREKAKSNAERLNFDLALASAHAKLEKYDELLPVARRLLTASPTSDTAFTLAAQALVHLGLWQDLEKTAQDRLGRLPDDLVAMRVLTDSAEMRGEPAKAIPYHQRILAASKATAEDFNRGAWNALLVGSVTEGTVEWARNATQMTQNNNYASLHTLASLYAELGKTTEAREVLLQAMDIVGFDEPQPPDWYVLGRIAEQYGVAGTAIAAYERVKPAEKSVYEKVSSHFLAQRRLQVLRKQAIRPAGSL
ncbi:MAG TPA: DUF3857 domain-containing protein [Terriglobales bacterium]|nr:DUF3857 domain-containing protein [Terriglobales bacterium]